MIFVGIIIFGVKKEKQYTDIRGSSEAKNYKFPAGFYISIVAGVLSIVAGSLFLIDKAIENLRRENEVLKAGGPVVAMKNADAVDHARGYQDPRIITSHTYSQPRSYYSQTGGYYVEANPYHQKKHYRMKDFAL